MQMEFIPMDLIGPSKLHLKEISNVLTVICMLPNYVICIPLTDQSADVVVNAYLREIYHRFVGSSKNLLDSGNDFKYMLFAEVASQFGIKHIHLSPYRCKANGLIEASLKFLKIWH